MARRELNFVGSGPLAVALGVAPERIKEFDRQVNEMVKADASIKDIVSAMNERGDMNDAEWASFLYSLGYFDAKLND